MRASLPVTRSYFFIGLILVFMLSIPLPWAESARGRLVALLAPSWNLLNTLAITSQPLANRPLKAAVWQDNRRPVSAKEEIQRLELENRQLRERLIEVQALTQAEKALEVELAGIDASPDVVARQERRKRELATWLTMRLDSLPARVIYRAPVAWNSTLWLNVGEANNKAIGRVVVAKNSPVTVGSSLIGVVDLVNAHQCRVRLITDSSLVSAVRVSRNGELLAKGEVHGSGLPLWRREGTLLQGIGFNYDFPDEEGPARDLRTLIVQAGDLLVTSGLDGLFPPGLRVAYVSSVQPLREGDYFYELDASPTAGDLDSLSLVSVLPPVGFHLPNNSL